MKKWIWKAALLCGLLLLLLFLIFCRETTVESLAKHQDAVAVEWGRTYYILTQTSIVPVTLLSLQRMEYDAGDGSPTELFAFEVEGEAESLSYYADRHALLLSYDENGKKISEHDGQGSRVLELEGKTYLAFPNYDEPENSVAYLILYGIYQENDDFVIYSVAFPLAEDTAKSD